MSAEQIADEIIAARRRKRVASNVRHLREECSYTLVGSIAIRQLNDAEIAAFRDAISACLKARCTPRRRCCEPNCDRCKPA